VPLVSVGVSIFYYIRWRREQAAVTSHLDVTSTPSEEIEKSVFTPQMTSPLFSVPQMFHSSPSIAAAFNDTREEKEVSFSAHQWTTETPPKSEPVKATSLPRSPPKAFVPAPSKPVLPEPHFVEVEGNVPSPDSTTRVQQPQPHPSGPKVNPLFRNVHR
jgi:hypothetical protein